MSTVMDGSESRGAAAIDDALEARNVMIAHSQWEELRRKAFEERRSMSEIVREAIDAHLTPREAA